MAKTVFYYGKKDLEGLKWVARVADFGVGLMVASGINEMYVANSYLQDRKDLLKGEVKRYLNLAFKEARRTDFEIKDNMRNKQYWLDYSDAVIDAAEDDITLFRIAIKQTLDNANVKESELISYVETARVLINLSIDQHKCIMEEARVKFGRDYTKDFAEYDLSKVRYWWTKMCTSLYNLSKENVNLNNAHTQGMFDRMCMKFADGVYIDECVKVANENNPDFVKNDIEVVD